MQGGFEGSQILVSFKNQSDCNFIFKNIFARKKNDGR